MSIPMTTDYSSIWGTSAPSSQSTTTSARSSTALDFLAVLATTDIKIYDSSQLGLREKSYHPLGRGAYAVVERGGIKNHDYVAVKMCRVPVAAAAADVQNAIDRQLGELGLEMRVLSHPQLRIHSNVVNIVGICLDNDFGYSSLSLVLEYSEYGNLRTFLLGKEELLEVETLVNLVRQVAQGLTAVHQQLISHSDVKAENCLVFKKSNDWIVCLSDFGGSLIGNADNLLEPMVPKYGTRLLNAPELRSRSAFNNLAFGIKEAMMTDVFSFGLLAWEILKCGRSYFDKEWLGQKVGYGDEDFMEAFLESLPYNGLLEISTNFIETKRFKNDIAASMQAVLASTLQDSPGDRAPMQTVTELIPPRLNSAPTRLNQEYQPICNWGRQATFFEMHGEIRDDLTLISHLPLDTQQRIVQEMKMLAASEAIAMDDRNHAAMCVAECYLLGFGVAPSPEMTVHWVLESSLLGSKKGQSWYNRIAGMRQCEAARHECVVQYFATEAELAKCPESEYLANRIRSQISSVIQSVTNSIGALKEGQESANWGGMILPDLFVAGAFVETLPLHIAAFIGDNKGVKQLMEKVSINVQCPRGFNALHYACIGGHLSTVELLLDYNSSSSTSTLLGVSPLHLCLCFPESDILKAVSLLLKSGADPHAKVIVPLKWDYHDLLLQGTPLEWAVRSRSRALVNALLPVAADMTCLEVAISQFYWEIAEDIFQYFSAQGQSVHGKIELYSEAFTPFGLWIAHGEFLRHAIHKTVTCFQKYGALTTQYGQDTALMSLMMSTRVIYDFDLIDVCLDVMSQDYIKWVDEEGNSALSKGITQSAGSGIWESILKKIVNMYSIQELESEINCGYSYLHLAVTHKSVVAARVLLERGVNVNQKTFDDIEETPLHICMGGSPTQEMFSILMQYGADLNARSLGIGVTPYESRLLGKPSRVDFLTSVLENSDHNFNFMPILYLILEDYMSSIVRSNYRTWSRDSFRLLLSSPRVTHSIDELYRDGLTLLHIAVRTMNMDAVSLLLEAGANANVPYRATNSAITLLPLQIAVNVGWRFWLHSFDQRFPQLQIYKSSAMAVSYRLLQWHYARGDANFRGITKLHLACRMNMPEEVDALIAAGEDPQALGQWPGHDLPLMPCDLVPVNFVDESDAFSTMVKENSYVDPEVKQALNKSITFELNEALAAQDRIQESLLRVHKT